MGFQASSHLGQMQANSWLDKVPYGATELDSRPGGSEAINLRPPLLSLEIKPLSESKPTS